MDKHLVTWCLLLLLGQGFPALSEAKVYVNDNVTTGKHRGEGIVELTCYDGEWINIINAHTSSCSGAYCTDEASPLDTTLLAELCTGVQTCTEDVSIPADGVKIEVRYQCLKVNPHNLCEATVSPVFYQNHVDIHTPRYPARQRDQCNVQCTVTGGLMYLAVYKSGGIHVRVLVNGVSTSLRPPQSYTDVNMFVFSYENTGMDDQGTWVRVSGNGARLQVDCKSSHSTTAAPGRSTPVTRPAEGVVGWGVEDTPTVDDDIFKQDKNETDSDADEPESTLVGDLLGGLLALIVVLIIGLAVTVLFCKRKKSTGFPNNEDSLTQVNKLPDVPPRPSVRPQRPVPPQGNDDGYLTLVESTTQVNKPAVSSRPCPVPGEGKEDGYLTPMETTTQVIKQSNVPSQQRPFHTQGKEDNYLTPVESTTQNNEPPNEPQRPVHTQGKEDNYLTPVESTTQNNEPPNVPSPQRPFHTQGKEDKYLTTVETTTQVNESNGPPRPAVRTRKGPVSDQGPEIEYLTPGERSSPNAPLGYDKIEQPVYLELENPAEYTDLDVYDTIGEAKTEEYTTPYSTS